MVTERIVVDNGYYSTAAYCNTPAFKPINFRSKVESTNLPDVLTSNTYLLTYKSTSYLVGEGAEQIDINLNKVNSKLHLLTTLTALGLANKHQELNFKLVANCPLNLYNKNNKRDLECYLSSRKNVEITIDGCPKIISIDSCLVFPQTLPVVYVNPQKSNVVGILDIGGLTAQGCITQNQNLIQSSAFTENLGTLILFNSIKKALNSKYNISIKDYEIENIVKFGVISDPINSLKIIDDLCVNHVNNIIKTIKLVGWNLETIVIMLTGGGSLFLEKYLNKVLPNYYLSNDPIFDNVKGLWEVSKYYYGG